MKVLGAALMAACLSSAQPLPTRAAMRRQALTSMRTAKRYTGLSARRRIKKARLRSATTARIASRVTMPGHLFASWRSRGMGVRCVRGRITSSRAETDKAVALFGDL